MIRGGYGLYIDQYNTAASAGDITGQSARPLNSLATRTNTAIGVGELRDFRVSAAIRCRRSRPRATGWRTTRPASGSIRTTTIRSRTRRTSATRTRSRRIRRWRWTTRASRDVVRCAARRSIRSSAAAGCWRTISSACSATRRTRLDAHPRGDQQVALRRSDVHVPAPSPARHAAGPLHAGRRVFLRWFDRQPVGRGSRADLRQAARHERVGTERSGRTASLRRDRRVRHRVWHPALARPAGGERAAV